MWEALARLRDALFGPLNAIFSRESGTAALVDRPPTLAELTSSQRPQPLDLAGPSRPVSFDPPAPWVQSDTEGEKTLSEEWAHRELEREA